MQTIVTVNVFLFSSEPSAMSWMKSVCVHFLKTLARPGQTLRGEEVGQISTPVHPAAGVGAFVGQPLSRCENIWDRNSCRLLERRSFSTRVVQT